MSRLLQQTLCGNLALLVQHTDLFASAACWHSCRTLVYQNLNGSAVADVAFTQPCSGPGSTLSVVNSGILVPSASTTSSPTPPWRQQQHRHHWSGHQPHPRPQARLVAYISSGSSSSCWQQEGSSPARSSAACYLHQQPSTEQWCNKAALHTGAIGTHSNHSMLKLQLTQQLRGAPQRQLHQQQTQQQHTQQQKQQQEAPQGSEQQGRAVGSSLTSIPNLLSLSRVAAAPVIAYQMATDQWGSAVVLLTLAAASDWADGAVARRLGHTSKLGSYLDPLADKVLVCTVVGTLGLLQLLPAWLATLIVARDVGQVGVTLAYRMSMFGWRWPGMAPFVDVDGAPGPGWAPAGKADTEQQPQLPQQQLAAQHQEQQQQQQQQQEQEQEWKQAAVGQAPSLGGGSSSSINPGSQSSQTNTNSSSSSTAGPADMPRIQPLFVSKLNTALAFVLIGSCVLHQWQGVPAEEVLQGLEFAVGSTTAASGVAYLWLYSRGRLLQR